MSARGKFVLQNNSKMKKVALNRTNIIAMKDLISLLEALVNGRRPRLAPVYIKAR